MPRAMILGGTLDWRETFPGVAAFACDPFGDAAEDAALAAAGPA